MKPVLLLVSLAISFTACSRFGSKTGLPHVKITAHKYAFEPSVIHLKEGQEVTLEISTVDVQHGFSSKALGIDESIQKGKPTLVDFKADRRGEYKLECNIICGPGHDRMEGKIIVE